MPPLPLPHETHGPIPLVMLHGLFGSGTNFRSVAKRLASDRNVHCLDLRNHGAAPWDNEHTYPAMAADVIAWLDRMGLKQVDLLGHSMGGKVAMTLALEAPQRVRRLIVVDIAPVTYAHSLAGYAQAMLDADLETAKTRRDVDQQLAQTIPEPGIRSFLLQNLKPAETGFAWRLHLAALLRHMDAIGAFPDGNGQTYAGDSLFLHGDRSDYVRREYETAILSRFPQARLQEVADCGHWIHAEQPEVFIQAVAAFIAPTKASPAAPTP